MLSKMLVVGTGSIGRRHIRNLKSLHPSVQIAVLRHGEAHASLGSIAPCVDYTTRKPHEAIGWGPQAAIVANPSSLHLETARCLAAHKVPMLIEKPLSNTLEQVPAFVAQCRKDAVTLLIGYNLRFYKPLQIMREYVLAGKIGRPTSARAEAGHYLPDWRPAFDYRTGVSARSDLGGGVLLELSHELDYLRWLRGDVRTISAQAGRVSNLEIDVEDTADIHLQFASGALGSVHLDMVDRMKHRTCRVTGTEGTLIGDFVAHRVYWVHQLHKESQLIYAGSNDDLDASYRDELRHFLNCLEGTETSLITGDDGMHTLELAIAAKRSSERREFVQL